MFYRRVAEHHRVVISIEDLEKREKNFTCETQGSLNAFLWSQGDNASMHVALGIFLPPLEIFVLSFS